MRLREVDIDRRLTVRLGYIGLPSYPDFHGATMKGRRTMEELLKEIAEIGYDTVELAAFRSQQGFPTYMTAERRKQIRKLLENLRLDIVCLDGSGGCPHYSSEYGYAISDSIERSGIIHFMKKVIDLACDLGADKVLDLSGMKSEEMTDKRAWEFLCSSVGEICDYASDKDVMYLMETEFGYLIHDAETALRLAREVDSNAFRMNLDYGNLLIDGQSELEAQKAVGALSKFIANAHVKGLRKGHVLMGRYDPVMPGSNEDVQDLKGFFAALERIRYVGSVSVEDFAEYSQPPIDIVKSAKQCYRNIARIMNEVGVRKLRA